MAIDPRQFTAPPAGSPQANKNATLVRRSADLLRNSTSILKAPQIAKSQINATINRTIKRIPARLQTAANNIAINAVTDVALGALNGFQSGEGLTGILQGGFSQGFNGLTGDVLGATDQILGQVGSDIGLGVGGIINNIGGGVLTGIGNPIISSLSDISIQSVISSIGAAGTNISGLFTNTNFVSADGGNDPLGTAIEAIDNDNREALIQVTGISANTIDHCSAGSKQKVSETAELLKIEGRDIVGDFKSHFNINTSSLSPTEQDEHKAKTQQLEAQRAAHEQASVELANITTQVQLNCPEEETPTIEHQPKHFASKLYPQFQPKSKFMFMVEFVFHPEYQQMLTKTASKDPISTKLAFEFVVKNSTRPNVSFEHEELNMYNFWTKVPKRTIYEPMTMRFYDDDSNSSNSFYTNYMRAMSPIANLGGSDSMILPQQYQEISSDPNVIARTGQVKNLQGGASLGSLNNDAVNILLEIKLYHLYDWGRSLNVYHMYNPKITNLNLDDVDMAESGAGSELEIQFAYDGLFVDPRIAATAELMAKISGGRTGVDSEIVPIFDDSVDQSGGDGLIEDGVVITKLKDQATRAITPTFGSQSIITPDYDKSTTFADFVNSPPGVF